MHPKRLSLPTLRFGILLVHVLWFALLACEPSATTKTTEPVPEQAPTVKRDSKGFEVDPPGQWYRGDMHVHATGASNDTGGESPPEDIARVAQERGLHFVVLTDHSNSTGSDTTTTDEDPKLFNQGPEFPYWEKVKSLSVPGKFLMIDGNEISPVAEGERPITPTGHIGCIPKDLETFDRSGAFIDRPKGTVTGKQALDQALKRGCFAIVNHPYAPTAWITYDWTSFGYNGMEIWNGGLGFDLFDEYGYHAWRCDLLKGRSVVPIAASDNHRVKIESPGGGLNPALGYPSTSIYAEKLTWPSLMQGLQAGKVSLHEGDSFLQLDNYDSIKRHTEASKTRWLRVRGTVDAKAKAPIALTLTRMTACVDPRPERTPPEVTETKILNQSLKPGDSFDYAIEIKGEVGVYTAMVRPSGEHYIAISRAIVIQ